MALLALAAPVAAQAPYTTAGTAAPTAAAPAPMELAEREAYVMGTRLSVRVEAPRAGVMAEAALEAVREVEDLLSSWRADTELSALNRSPVGEAHGVSPELMAVLEEVSAWVERTSGAFDPAVGALVDAWELRGEGRVATAAARAAALEATGWDRLVVSPSSGTVTRTADGVWLDAGGFGKGLALREAARALRDAGGRGVLNFGGQVMAVGTPARVGVAHPAARDVAVAELVLRDASASTTAASERFIEVDGERYGHVLDPRTGMPVRPWGSVTVVAEDPMVADLLSTALFVMGPEAALEWSAARPEGVLVVTGSGGVRTNGAMARWLAAPAAGSPGTTGAAQDTTELARLQRQVDAITRELERMRLGGDVVPAADTSRYGFGPAASKIYQVDHGVSIGGYGEVLYRFVADELESGEASPATNRFDALRAIIYLGYKFSDRLLVNTEIEIEHGNEAYLEFAYLDYLLNDYIGLRGGLLLSPMGLVNELHEPPVFLGTTRPLVEQRVIPTTWRENGLGIFGDVGPLSYRAYAMNGLNGLAFSDAGLRGGRQKGSNALAEDVGGVVRVDYTGVLGLLAGGSVYYGGSGQGATVDGQEVQASTLIWEGHASYQSRGLDLRALVAGATVDEADLLNQAGAGGVAEALGGGYAHVGYDVLRHLDTTHQLFPYVRYEWLDTQKETAAGVTPTGANDVTAILLGASWKPVPQVAVKGDYQIHSTAADTGRNQFALVLSYLF